MKLLTWPGRVSVKRLVVTPISELNRANGRRVALILPPAAGAEERVGGVVEDLIAPVIARVDRQRATAADPAVDAVRGREEVDAAEPFQGPDGIRADPDVSGEIEAESEPPVFVLEHAGEIPGPAVPEFRSPVDEPALRPPAVAGVAEDAALVKAAHEPDLGVEVGRDLVRRREPTEIAPGGPDAGVVDVTLPFHSVQVAMRRFDESEVGRRRP